MSTAAHAAAVLLGIATPQEATGAAPPVPAVAADTETAAKSGEGATAAKPGEGAAAGGATTADGSPALPAPSAADEWHFLAAAYIWLPGVSGTVGAKGVTANVDVTIGDTIEGLSNLQFGLTGHFEAHKGDLGLIFDAMYMAFEGTQNTVPLGKVRAQSSMGIFETAGSWHLYGERRTIIGPALLVEAIGGARIWAIDTSIKANSVGLKASNDSGWVDGFGGVRMALSTGSPFIFDARFDAGAGGSKFTWNAIVGVEYNFNETIAAAAGWRWLSVDRDPGGPNNPKFDLTMSGPYGAIAFRF